MAHHLVWGRGSKKNEQEGISQIKISSKKITEHVKGDFQSGVNSFLAK